VAGTAKDLRAAPDNANSPVCSAFSPPGAELVVVASD
jgi:hypothetical protein